MKPNLLLIKNEFETKRVLPEVKAKPLAPPVFDEDPKHLIDFWNPGLKWWMSLKRF